MEDDLPAIEMQDDSEPRNVMLGDAERASSQNLEAYRAVVHGERAKQTDDVSSVFKLATTYTNASFCGLCGVNALWIFLTVALTVGGLHPIASDKMGEVGLQVMDDPYQRRANAYNAGKEEANMGVVSGRCARADVGDPILLTMLRGDFEEETKGNALTAKGLATLRERENRIMDKAGWADRCALVYSETYPKCVVSAAASAAGGCQRPYSPVFFFENYGDPDFADIAGTVAKIKAAGATEWAAFTGMLHKDFKTSNLKSKFLSSSVFAGTPRYNVSHYVDEATEARIKAGAAIEYYTERQTTHERDHLNHWIVEELADDFLKDTEDSKYPTLFSYVDYDPLTAAVSQDMLLILGAIVIVAVYMWCYTGSAFITACGMFQIVCSFFAANIFYRYFWPTAFGFGYQYFTLFCALSLFIIMGIGADDIFVYWDLWQASASETYKTPAHRMSHVHGHAAFAMLVTSSTTVFSFLTNVSSPFIGISTFGVYAALLVFVNWCAVVTFFPCCVLFYDKNIKDRASIFKPCADAVKRMLGRGQEKAPPKEGDGLAAWFGHTYAPKVNEFRYAILACFFVVWVVFLAFACMLKAQPFLLYEMLPAESNFYRYIFIQQKWVPLATAPLNAHVLFGFDHKDPLNTHGMKPENFVQGDAGDASWDDSFSVDAEAAQLQFIDIAEALARAPGGLKVDVTAGINSQLGGSHWGSLLGTADGGASASLQSAYGIQSLFHALRQYENRSVSTGGGAYETFASDQSSTCVPCFETFEMSPDPASLDNFRDGDGIVSPLTLDATSPLKSGCNCYGTFPVPATSCLEETAALAEGTLFRCTTSAGSVGHQLGELISSSSPDVNWWNDFIFASADSNGNFERIAFIDIQVQTQMRASEGDFEVGMKFAADWDDWMDDMNARYGLQGMVYLPGAEFWKLSSLLLPSGVQNMLLSLLLAFIILTLASGNWITAFLATFTIGMIVTIVLGFIQIVGWGLGTLESVLIVIVIGFSVDYTVHLADSYGASSSLTREAKVADALVHTGASVLSGAISTLGASLPMFGAQVIFFFKFGVFIFVTIALSLAFSLGFFAAALCVVGPLGDAGALSNLYKPLVAAAQANIDEVAADKARLLETQKGVHEAQKEKNYM